MGIRDSQECLGPGFSPESFAFFCSVWFWVCGAYGLVSQLWKGNPIWKRRSGHERKWRREKKGRNKNTQNWERGHPCFLQDPIIIIIQIIHCPTIKILLQVLKGDQGLGINDCTLWSTWLFDSFHLHGSLWIEPLWNPSGSDVAAAPSLGHFWNSWRFIRFKQASFRMFRMDQRQRISTLQKKTWCACVGSGRNCSSSCVKQKDVWQYGFQRGTLDPKSLAPCGSQRLRSGLDSLKSKSC